MRLPRLLKSSTKSTTAEEKRGGPSIPRIPNRQRWHEEVKRCADVLEFLFNGRPPIDTKRARSLNNPTTEYLTALNPNIVRPSDECDQILTGLIDEHAANDPLTSCVAVLACIRDLSLPIATEYLASLLALEIDRYLRCIIVASQIRPEVISAEEIQNAKLLLLILFGQARGLQEFGHLIQSLARYGFTGYLPLQTIHAALVKSGFRSHLQSQIHACLNQQQFMTAFGLVSWLQTVTESPNNGDVIALLDAHFQSWPWLAIWRPNLDRINIWEHGHLSRTQRQKLSNVFRLDGPDVETQKQSSLRLAVPQCYRHVKLEPKDSTHLEHFLDILYRACFIGPNAIDLFIQQCTGRVVSTDMLSTVDDAVQTGEDTHCASLLEFARALSSQHNLTDDVQALTEFLSNLGTLDKLAHPEALINQLANHLCRTMQLAQQEFCKQLRSGPADYMGMLVHELGMAVLQCSKLHSRLPPDFIERIKQFPQQKTLEAIFDELQDDGENSASHSSRFKSYLLSSLGGDGNSGSGSVTLANVQDEIKFWKHPPDQSRKDLAKALGEIPGLDYTLYTTCLHAMFKEHDLYISQMKGNIDPEDEETGLNFAKYLAYRRKLHQMQNPCWLLLTASLLRSQKTSFLPRMADSASFVEWDKLVGDLESLLAPIRDQLPESGAGLTRERMTWWKTLSKNVPAVQFLLQMHGQQRSLRWLYFPNSTDHVMPLLQVASQGKNMSSLDGQIISYLSRNGNNAVEVCDCIRLLAGGSSFGKAVCERFLSREGSHWTQNDLHAVFVAWSRHKSLTSADRSALDSVRLLLRLSPAAELRASNIRSTNDLLQSEFDNLFREARKLESLRLRLQHQTPQRVATILSQIGVESLASGRVVDERIPDELVDAIDEIGDSEYELSFALTGLSGLQRQARGIHSDSRMLLVRLCLRGDPQFCIHLSPNDEGQGRHRYWRPIDHQEPATTSCSTKTTLFTYYIGRKLHYLLRKGQPSLQTIYSSIQNLVTAHPTSCLVCSNSIGTKLWKPAACTKKCSKKLRKAPLEVRLHNLLVDPAAVDLLLTCVYAAAADTSTLDLLPGCPVKKNRIATVIDTFPALSSFQTVPDLKAAIQGSDGLGKEREDLLSWLCLKFRGFLLSAQSSFRVPSMPGTHQFLMLNSNHEREALFNAQAPAAGSGRVIFHGTQISRMFLILTEGLKVMSNTPFMLTGAARGVGIYCGDDQATSLNYAGATGQSWKNSTLGNMRVMLGCELSSAAPSAQGTYHVVTDENSLLVRYVFLLPITYQPPPRHHVEPAMNITYANLRSGTLI